MTEQEHDHIEERRVLSRRERRGGGRMLCGLLLAGIGGFWLTTNLTDNVALIADNPGRVVLPTLTILLGVAAMFVKRDPRHRNTD
jgi:hypothetical protein